MLDMDDMGMARMHKLGVATVAMIITMMVIALTMTP